MKTLTDKNMSPIGFIDTKDDKQWILDKNMRPLGYYDMRTDSTYSNDKGYVGSGNLIGTLIEK